MTFYMLEVDLLQDFHLRLSGLSAIKQHEVLNTFSFSLYYLGHFHFQVGRLWISMLHVRYINCQAFKC
jgi:hypothetical protein